MNDEDLRSDQDLLAIELTHLNGEAVLAVRGEIDVATAPHLRESVQRACNLGVPVVLDMALVTFMDSSGISALIKASGAGSEAPIPLRIHSPSEPVRRLLTITGLDKVFPIVP